MADFNPIKQLREIGGVFRFGVGALGKSAIILGILMLAVVVAAFKLHSDTATIAVIVIAAVIFFVWLFRILKFAGEHPDIALLEGAEWSGWKRFEAGSKYPPPPEADKQPTIESGTQTLTINSKVAEEPDK